jgi:hypothetical protein
MAQQENGSQKMVGNGKFVNFVAKEYNERAHSSHFVKQEIASGLHTPCLFFNTSTALSMRTNAPLSAFFTLLRHKILVHLFSNHSSLRIATTLCVSRPDGAAPAAVQGDPKGADAPSDSEPGGWRPAAAQPYLLYATVFGSGARPKIN